MCALQEDPLLFFPSFYLQSIAVYCSGFWQWMAWRRFFIFCWLILSKPWGEAPPAWSHTSASFHWGSLLPDSYWVEGCLYKYPQNDLGTMDWVIVVNLSQCQETLLLPPIFGCIRNNILMTSRLTFMFHLQIFWENDLSVHGNFYDFLILSPMKECFILALLLWMISAAPRRD